MKYNEHELQASICRYLKYQYPDVLFVSDLSGINKTPGARGRHFANSKQGFSCPDLLIFEPNETTGKLGLFIELKYVNIYKKNGELLAKEHLRKQDDSLKMLEKRGYKACFSVGFDETKIIIDEYLKHLKK